MVLIDYFCKAHNVKKKGVRDDEYPEDTPPGANSNIRIGSARRRMSRSLIEIVSRTRLCEGQRRHDRPRGADLAEDDLFAIWRQERPLYCGPPTDGSNQVGQPKESKSQESRESGVGTS